MVKDVKEVGTVEDGKGVKEVEESEKVKMGMEFKPREEADDRQ